MTTLLGALALIALAVALAAIAGRRATPTRPHVTDDRLGHIERYAAAART